MRFNYLAIVNVSADVWAITRFSVPTFASLTHATRENMTETAEETLETFPSLASARLALRNWSQRRGIPYAEKRGNVPAGFLFIGNKFNPDASRCVTLNPSKFVPQSLKTVDNGRFFHVHLPTGETSWNSENTIVYVEPRA
jgi:hypothetical protein